MGSQGYVETPVSLEDLQEEASVVEQVVTPEEQTEE